MCTPRAKLFYVFMGSGKTLQSYQTLTRLALNDEGFIAEMTRSEAANLAASGLDRRTQALVRIGALLAADAAPATYASVVRMAKRADVGDAEIVGVLIAVIPDIGIARAVSAAPELGLSLGFDVDAVIEGDRELGP